MWPDMVVGFLFRVSRNTSSIRRHDYFVAIAESPACLHQSGGHVRPLANQSMAVAVRQLILAILVVHLTTFPSAWPFSRESFPEEMHAPPP